VVAASAARVTVLSGGARSTAVSTNGLPLEKDNSNALGVPRQRGQPSLLRNDEHSDPSWTPFNASDGPNTPRVTIVTKSLADRLWPHEDPNSQMLRDENTQLQVVGVVPDTVYTTTLERERPPTYYLLLAQNYESGVTLHVRAASNPMSLVAGDSRSVRQVDSQLAVERPAVAPRCP
jgi:hypothetical protein